jgi:hypothetical protein
MKEESFMIHLIARAALKKAENFTKPIYYITHFLFSPLFVSDKKRVGWSLMKKKVKNLQPSHV